MNVFKYINILLINQNDFVNKRVKITLSKMCSDAEATMFVRIQKELNVSFLTIYVLMNKATILILLKSL